VIVEGVRYRDPNSYEMLLDIMHVANPSSVMHRWIMIFQTMTEIWKDTKEGRRGSELSKSNITR